MVVTLARQEDIAAMATGNIAPDSPTDCPRDAYRAAVRVEPQEGKETPTGPLNAASAAIMLATFLRGAACFLWTPFSLYCF